MIDYLLYVHQKFSKAKDNLFEPKTIVKLEAIHLINLTIFVFERARNSCILDIQ